MVAQAHSTFDHDTDDEQDDVQLEGEAADPGGGAETDDDAPPPGFEAKAGDLLAYWEPASQGNANTGKAPSSGSPAVLFTPLHVTLSDSKQKPRRGEAPKSSTLIHCRLERDCRLRSAQKEEGYKIFPKGTLFGIWAKPGMSALKKLGGTVVWMKNAGFRNVGQPQDMVVFDIKWEKDGAALKVLEDRRQQSLPTKLREARAEVVEKYDEIPF